MLNLCVCWQQQHERYSLGPAYDPSRDLSPNLPVHSSDSSSAGEGEGCSSSTTSTVGGGPSDNNNSSGLLSASCCRFSDFSKQQGSPSGPLAPPLPAPLAQCKMEEEHAVGSNVNCAGCGARICDRFYLLAVDRKWHVTCLQCSQCRQPLDGEVTCFARDGNIYCKKDYYR